MFFFGKDIASTSDLPPTYLRLTANLPLTYKVGVWSISLRADEEEEHGEEDKSEVEEFSSEIPLMKEHGATEEGDDNATTTDHADDTDHGFVLTEGIEIDEVGS